ncbi:acyl-CoA Delta-9 desaturase-like [Musca vetustissima]|uniref:acyl-CoA Delta-9 desaturase-like n=1 Tax=Musca vetustissima TaxID=27455 RepID=UPI002AB6F66B|nr:acyl-CoA Delta-9 desaturase-like [Musca vetustissima]
MPPNLSIEQSTTGILEPQEADTIDGGLVKDIEQLKHAKDRKLQIVWRNVIIFVYANYSALYGLYLLCTTWMKWQTLVMMYLGGFGITVGAHRLWAHRAYKAKLPMRIMLMIFNTMSFQNPIYIWVRDHRVHHKFSETDADPHNAMRGFFFSHVGWLLVRKHPDVITKGKTVDLSDLKADPVVMFQLKHYGVLMYTLTFILPTIIPMICWGETMENAWYFCTVFRWYFILNGTWCINSVCHLFGNKPYDKSYNPGENHAFSGVTIGECYHNYHHVFPWDYKAAELGGSRNNISAAVIEFFAKIGWAYDMKTVSPDIIRSRVLRTGDGTHPVWGWGDKDQTKEEIESAVIVNNNNNDVKK